MRWTSGDGGKQGVLLKKRRRRKRCECFPPISKTAREWPLNRHPATALEIPS